MLIFDNEYTSIPAHTQNALIRYIEHRIMPGGFLTAVLSNDLVGAVFRADMSNRVELVNIVQFIYNRLPETSWGSIEKMYAWCDKRVLNNKEDLEVEGF